MPGVVSAFTRAHVVATYSSNTSTSSLSSAKEFAVHNKNDCVGCLMHEPKYLFERLSPNRVIIVMVISIRQRNQTLAFLYDGLRTLDPACVHFAMFTWWEVAGSKLSAEQCRALSTGT
jgi:hypothetical protein